MMSATRIAAQRRACSALEAASGSCFGCCQAGGMFRGRAFARRVAASAAHPPVLCEDDSTVRAAAPGKSRGVVLVTKGANPEVQALLLHLQAAGIRHVSEVRKLSDGKSRRGCTRERFMHHFVEAVVNTSGAALGPTYIYIYIYTHTLYYNMLYYAILYYTIL